MCVSTRAEEPQPAGEPAPAAGGMKAYADPQTGALLPAPPAGARPEPASPEFSQSAVGLREEPAPGGGVMVDLQGRFQSAMVATVGADGSVRIECQDQRPSAR